MVLIYVLLGFLSVHETMQWPQNELADIQTNDIPDMELPITVERVKQKLIDYGIFDWRNAGFEQEVGKLFDDLELYISSRNRQPSSVQTTFATLSLVRSVVDEKAAKGRISKDLADKFIWTNMPTSSGNDLTND